MATAEAAVCNVALIRVGATKLLENLNGTDVTSRTCKALFEPTRDQLLQLRPWPFATQRADLAVLADDEDDTEGRSGWGFTYDLPADCIAPRYIWSGVDNPTKEQEIPWKLESSATLLRRVLLTNQEDAELIYTAKVTEVGRWDPLFREAMAMKLASDFAFGIAKKPALGTELLKHFYATLGIASASAGNQQQALPRPVSEFEAGRS